VRREANHVHSKRFASMKVKETGLEHRPGDGKGLGEDTPSGPKSSGCDDEEEEATSPPNFPPPEDLPSLGDLFSQ
jgi:hypothetical protein